MKSRILGGLLLALLVFASSASALPYLRTESLKFRRTGTGLRNSAGSGTITYADSTTRNWASGQRADTLYFTVPDLALVRSAAAAADSAVLFSIFVIPDPLSAITVVADSAYWTVGGTVGSGGGWGVAGNWAEAPNIGLLEIGTLNCFVRQWNFQFINPTPLTPTNVTMGDYDQFRVVASGDYTGTYRYFLRYWAESTVPHQPLQR